MADLTFTGERFLPSCRGEIWLEHWHRYHFAATLAQHQRVLDVASGEGYGTALLARTATSAVGLDASADAVGHARDTYGYLTNVAFVRGDCARLPFADAAFDLVVSFETIEHIAAQREFLAEVRRVLTHDGLFVLSSPNKAEYSDRRGYANPFHVAELYRDELSGLLGEHFAQTLWYGQRIGFCSTISAEQSRPGDAGELVGSVGSGAGSIDASPAGIAPLYYLVGCANVEAALVPMQRAFSVLTDPDDRVYRDYEETYRKFVAASEAVATFRQREADIDDDRNQVRESARKDIEFIQERLAVAEARIDAMHSDAAELRAEAERARLEADALKALTTRLGASAHQAQQAQAQLTAELHAMQARAQAELAALQKSADDAMSTLLSERQRHREERAQHEEVQRRLAAAEAELDRRGGWKRPLVELWRRRVRRA